MTGTLDYMAKVHSGATVDDFQRKIGRTFGVVRFSLGLASNFQDVWRVVQFASLIAADRSRQVLWDQWLAAVQTGTGL